MLGEEYVASLSKNTPGSRRVTPSKTLPTEVRTPNSNKDRLFGGSIPRISLQTVHRLLTTEIKCNYVIIDCRFPYEFEGGHIATAINCPPSEKLMLMDWLFNAEYGIANGGPTVLVMHCEFSQCRAPRLATDVLREYLALGVNTGLEVYIMKGGYSEFYRQYRSWCDPMGYVAMYVNMGDFCMLKFRHDEKASRVSSSSFAPAFEFNADMFLEKNSVSSQKERRRRFRISGSIGGVSAPSDSPFFPAACSPMDFSPVAADLARVFVEEKADDSSNSSTGKRNVYIHTEEEDEEESVLEEAEDTGLEPPVVSGLPSLSPSRSSSCSSIGFPLAKRRASESAVFDWRTK